MLLDPENTLFVRGATPVLLLADAPVHDALPVWPRPTGRCPRVRVGASSPDSLCVS